ncbi:MAG: uracil-DNA glycosylase [Phycisphaerae bacterium]|nr:uracil-DNA glycosylase [Phycisphaerae bacterium]
MDSKQEKLDQLARVVAACCECPLHKSRLNCVPGEGDPNARIVFVGEAPGQSEDEQGRPFVGRSGDLLTNIIGAMGLSRQAVFIGNILKCRPPNNANPTPEQVAACSHFLHEQLAIIQPEVVVALGACAAQTLLKCKTPIGRLRGEFHEYRPTPDSAPIKLVATYHPSYLLRNYTPDARLSVWKDMQDVLKELGMPIPKK